MSFDSYMEHGFCNQRRNIAEAIKRIQAGCEDFDSIAVTGVSGMIFGPILAYEMNKNIVIVRQTLSVHSIYEVLSSYAPCKYLIVDDLIASGKTVKHITDKITKYYPNSSCAGVYLYSSLQLFSRQYLDIYLH